MELSTALAHLSSDQVSAIKNYEQELATKFGRSVILLAFDSQDKK